MSAPSYRLEKNRSGYFEARWSEKQPSGKYRSKSWSTGCKDKASAKIATDNFFHTASQITNNKGGKTVQDIADAYLESAEGRDVGETQKIALSVTLRHFGPYVPAEVTNDVVQEYIRARRGKIVIDGLTRKNKKGEILPIKDGTIRRDLGTLVAALNYGMRHRMFLRADLPVVDLPPDSPPREVWLDEKEEPEFWQMALDHSNGQNRLTRLTRFVCIGLETAARTEAIEELEWARVDWIKGQIDFRVPGRRLSNKRRAVVPISSRLRPILEQAYAERTGPFVVDEGSIRTTFENFVAGTKFDYIQKHDLRRTWATLTARAGGNLDKIARVLADDIRTVMKHYAKHHPDYLNEVMDIRQATSAIKAA